MFDELTLQPFLEDLEQIYDKVLAEYPELSSLGEINSELIKQIQEVNWACPFHHFVTSIAHF